MKIYIVFCDTRTYDGYGSVDIERVFMETKYAEEYINQKAIEFAQENMDFMETEEQEIEYCRSKYHYEEFEVDDPKIACIN